MKKRNGILKWHSYLFRLLILVAAITTTCVLPSNAQVVQVEKTSLSSRIYDEFSPVRFGKGLVFCTNRRDNSLMGYRDDEQGLFRIFYAESANSVNWGIPTLLSKDLIGGFNEGPVTFNSPGTLIYFTRNNGSGNKMANVTDSSNKLGIYSAELINGMWTGIKPFTFNDPRYVFATPSLSPEGKRIYFASDMPGGFGGMDIYYCDSSESGWCKPVNMGPVINTGFDESFPFAGYTGKVYFASEGHPGFGRKDLYYTAESEGTWIRPVALDSLINTPADDFGIFVDSTGLSGFFSSDRLKNDDIFRFTTQMPEFPDCDTFHAPDYCFTFYDERFVTHDTLSVLYKWDFGNGVVKTGNEAGYCFPGPGNYLVKLDITDPVTGDSISHADYKVNLDEPRQLFINSPVSGLSGKEIPFDATGSVIPYSEISGYLWDFGDGFTHALAETRNRFAGPGKYMVKLGVTGREKGQKQCISKEIRIFDSFETILTHLLNGQEIRVLTGDLDKIYYSQLKGLFEGSGIILQVDNYGITAASRLFLEKVISGLKEFPDIRLEIRTYCDENTGITGHMMAREIAFFFKNLGVSTLSAISLEAKENELLAGNSSKDTNSTVEFIFMKK